MPLPPIKAIGAVEKLSKAAPVFKSVMAEGVAAKAVTRTGKEWEQYLVANRAKMGVKEDEIEFSGILPYLQSKSKDKISSSELQNWIQENGIQVEEKLLDNPNETILRENASNAYAKFLEASRARMAVENETPGVIDRERLAPLEEIEDAAYEALQKAKAELSLLKERRTQYTTHQLPGGDDYKEILLTLPMKAEEKSWTKVETSTPFTSGHFSDTPNILAWIRFNTRKDAEGKKVLFIEEIQSDWAQKGRKAGFKDPKAKERFEAAIEKYNEADTQYNNALDDTNVGPAEMEAVIAARDEAFENLLKLETAFRRNRGVPFAPFVTDTDKWTALALRRMIRYAADTGHERIAWTTGEQQFERWSRHESAKGLIPFYNEKIPSIAKKVSGVEVKDIHFSAPEDEIDELFGKEPRLQKGFDITPELKERAKKGLPLMELIGSTAVAGAASQSDKAEAKETKPAKPKLYRFPQ